jgi:hypothetical protein
MFGTAYCLHIQGDILVHVVAEVVGEREERQISPTNITDTFLSSQPL